MESLVHQDLEDLLDWMEQWAQWATQDLWDQEGCRERKEREVLLESLDPQVPLGLQVKALALTWQHYQL